MYFRNSRRFFILQTIKEMWFSINENRNQWIQPTNGCKREGKRNGVKQGSFLHVDKTETSQRLWQGGDDGAVSLGVIEELKEGCGDEFVIARHGKVRLLRQLNHEELAVLLRLGDVGWNVGILCRLKIWPPPISDCIFYDPLLINKWMKG